MPATPSANKPSSDLLLAFTPRQVLLTTKQTMTKRSSPDSSKHLLHQSIARYLDRCGFSKSLKKFCSEAQIEKDMLEDSSIDLEEMCLKYLEIRGKNAKSNTNDQKEQAAFVHSEEGKSKEKKKKKSKLVSESLANGEDNQLESQTTVMVKKGKDDASTDAKIVDGSEMEKSKNKKKKKEKKSNQGDTIEQIGDLKETVLEKDNTKASSKEVKDDEKNESKKRKRPTSEENGQQIADKKVDEEPKRRKIENESKGGEQLSNGQTNGHLENAGEKSSAHKSQKKQDKESNETSAKKAFQRVQVDKVKFADERLQDNSYWAKDGAETGYGAKAEEILGQVRGKDFRHEKTKKKRGTYRGGNIDLQSHSIKFNYSDEE